MMNIENINMWLTIVSIICTVASIVFSIISIRNARKAKDYKEKAEKVLFLTDVQTVIAEYENISKDFVFKTRDNQWYKGQDPNDIIKPFNDILMKFSALYPQIDNENELKDKVHLLSSNIINYETVTQKKKKETNNTIYEISELLHKIRYKANQGIM